MEIINQFINFLNLDEYKASPLTIKNYRADVLKFVAWMQSRYDFFDPTLASKETITAYKNDLALSPRSIERHLSSLRKFFLFLKTIGIIETSPFSKATQFVKEKESDIFKLIDFKNHLYVNNKSSLTIKNYINDIRQFMEWLFDVSDVNKTWYVPDQNIFGKVSALSLEEYKNRLYGAQFSLVSINRKLSSIRSYVDWLTSNNFIKTAVDFPSYEQISDSLDIETPSEEIKLDSKLPKYSKFPPFRLIQKINKGLILVFDTLFIIPLAKIAEKVQYALWKINGGFVFKNTTGGNPQKSVHEIENYKKTMYAPLLISTTHFPLHRKLIYKIRHSRPNWYKRYHSSPVIHYLHLSLLLLFVFSCGLLIYQSFTSKKESNVLGSSIQEELYSNKIPFNGRLTDLNGNPITKPTNVLFALYSEPNGDGSLLWHESQQITPNKDGSFTTALGKSEIVPSSAFASREPLYLGVSIDDNEELKPRSQIPTASYASNAQTLQGLPVITETNAPKNNVILALDSASNLTIGGNTSTTFQAIGGQFTLSGNTLLLTTTAGSSKDIQISPDGLGTVDFQKPIRNTTNNNNIQSAIGAVEIDDMLAILATSSGQSAFTISQNGTGPIISASSGAIAKFTVENDGTGYLSGNFGIGKQNPIAKLQVEGSILPGLTNEYNLGSPSLRWNTIYANTVIASASGTFGYWQRNDGSISLSNTSDSLNIGDVATSSAIIHLGGTNDEQSFFKTKVGIGIISPSAMLQIQGKGNGSDASFVVSNSSGNKNLVVLDNGNIGIGDTDPQAALKVVGSLCVKGGAGSCTGNTPGTIYATNTTLQAGDIAEIYISKDILEPGDVVAIADDGNNQAIVKTTTSYQANTIGIISTKPGVTINSDAATDAAHPYSYPLALTGRVMVKVSNENGKISAGDYLTASSIPGIAMKTGKTGTTIGKALEDFNCSSLDDSLLSKDQGLKASDQICQGKIMVFASVSFYNPYTLTSNIDTVTIENPTLSDTAIVLPEENPLDTFVLKSNLEKTIDRIGVFSSAVIANLKTGMIQAQKISTKALEADIIVSPIAQIEQLHAGIISPITNESDIVVELPSNGELIVKNASGGAVASIDASGNAKFEGNIEAKEASISGTLRAGRIIADSIDGLPISASAPAQYVTNITNVYSTPSAETILSALNTNNNASNSSELNALLNSDFASLNPVNIATFSAQLAKIDVLSSSFGKFSEGLMSLGPTSLTDTSINGQLSVGRNLIIEENAINTLGTALEIQPLRLGNISFMSGLLTIDTDGNLDVKGNASFAKDVSIKGKLSAGIISPLPSSDVKIELGAETATESSLVVQNASGSAVLSINALGDLVASGSATLKKLNLNLIQQAQAVSDIEVIATGSAGVATISAQRSSITIDNSLVTEKSLIYITPRDQTDNQTLFLLRQEPNRSFTVGVQNKIYKNIPFNWLIIN